MVYFSLRQQTKHFLLSASKILNIFCLLSPCSAVNQSQFLNPAWRCLNKEKSPSQFGCVHFLHPPSVFHSLFFFSLEIRVSTHCHTDPYISFLGLKSGVCMHLWECARVCSSGCPCWNRSSEVKARF